MGIDLSLVNCPTVKVYTTAPHSKQTAVKAYVLTLRVARVLALSAMSSPSSACSLTYRLVQDTRNWPCGAQNWQVESGSSRRNPGLEQCVLDVHASHLHMIFQCDLNPIMAQAELVHLQDPQSPAGVSLRSKHECLDHSECHNSHDY